MDQRLFGTNGVRGIVNKDMDLSLALQLGKAIGTFVKGELAIATDTRTSRHMLSAAVAAGISSVGADVLDLGVLPTPALQFFVKRREEVNGGVMVTASHNPPEFNGIKCVDGDGTEMPRHKEEAIEALFWEGIEPVPWDRIGRIREVSGAKEEYLRAIVSQIDADAVRAAGLTVVMDCANGAAHSTGPELMGILGVRSITINADPQGKFPGHPSEPTEENLHDLIHMVKVTGADMGVAFDGDADRAVFVDDKGRYLTGDKSLALIAKAVLREKKGTVVTPVSSSSMVEEVVSAAGGKVEYTAVGSPVVARRMMDIGAVFGGEENGGLIFPSHQFCRDGAMTVAKMLELVVRSGPLSKCVDSLPLYYTVKRKFACPNKSKQFILDYARRRFADMRVDNTDGVKIFFDDGWVLLRPSGTEPIFRVYSEASSPKVAEERADSILNELKEQLTQMSH